MKKVATEIKIGEQIASPNFSGIWGVVNNIEETAKKITFKVTYTQHPDGFIGRSWQYSFFKTTKVKFR